jgi:outer membrane beta-barrel protein
MTLKMTIIAILFTAMYSAPQVLAADQPLEEQLKTLELPGNVAPAAVSREKLYVVQTRYLPLRFKNEFSLGVAQNFTGDSFLTTRQLEVGYRFHLSDKFSIGISEAWVSNQFTSEANQLVSNEGLAPDVDYARQREELTVAYNVFYGKFRLSSDQVFYFDQYVAAGPGLMRLNTGDFGAIVADVGFVFWMSNWGSTRIGVKDYAYAEDERTDTGLSHNIHAHLDVGYLF